MWFLQAIDDGSSARVTVLEDHAMKKILLSLAAAQSWRDDAPRGHDYGYRDDGVAGSVDRLQWRIDHAAREGRISWREAHDLRDQLGQARSLAWKVRTGRANGWERQRLGWTIHRIEAAVSGDDRYDRGYDGRRDWRD